MQKQIIILAIFALLLVGLFKVSTPIAPNATNQCNNDTDRGQINARWSTFWDDIGACGEGCIGASTGCTQTCDQKLGFTAGCALCFQDINQCLNANCVTSCIFSKTGSKCKNCAWDKCIASSNGLFYCAGLSSTEFPPRP